MAIQTTDIGKQQIIEYGDEGEVKKIGSSFFRGDTVNLNPYQRDFKKSDFLKKYLLKGWIPSERFLKESTKITAFGSCFANNITNHLSSIGFSLSKQRNPDIYISTMGEGLVNVYALAQQFEWALEGINPPEGLWQGYKAEDFGYDEGIRKKTRDAMLSTDFFIITLGLSEVWYDEETQGVFWRAVPREKYDPNRHKFRVCSMAETKQKLNDIINIIQKHVPSAKVLFTLSPVPLAATFRNNSCITSNSASKAILRAALDELMRDHADQVNERLFYFPSYEVIMDLFYSRYTADGRHPHDAVIKLIMNMFEATYCDTALSLDEVEALYQSQRIENGRVAYVESQPKA